MPKAPVRIKALMPALSLMSVLKTSAYVAVALRHNLASDRSKGRESKAKTRNIFAMTQRPRGR